MRKPNSKPSKGKVRPLAADKGDKKKAKKISEEHPVAQALDVFLHKCEDIKLAVQSSCSADIKIAEAVLLDRFEEAGKLMKKIGKEGEIITEQAYHTWPLFKFFRTSSPFLKTYEEVYGRPFIVELKKAAEKSQLPSGGGNGKA